MTSYMITARKWRPASFDEVIGQEHVTQTLRNALRHERLAQSYLFSGSRGVGKTTLARIYAKALNCQNGPTETPCGKCSFCKEVDMGNALHYREIDGASHRGIDQIRNINESLQYASPQKKYRIFVIDEVHMLTIEAFNALLKSIEEPPPKIVFIFCTTESYKVPLTIRSRCQHYAFKAFSIEVIQGHLRSILKAEAIPHDEDSLFHIAQAAAGSMRDSQNTLDQVLAYSHGKLTVKETLEVLGKTDFHLQKNFIEALLQNDLNASKRLITGLRLEGTHLSYFLYEMLHVFSVMVYVKEGIDDVNLLEVDHESIAFLKDVSPQFEREELFLISDLIFECLKEIKATINEAVLMDLFLIRLHRYKTLITPESLKAQLMHFSKQIVRQSEDLPSTDDLKWELQEAFKALRPSEDIPQKALTSAIESLKEYTLKDKTLSLIFKGDALSDSPKKWLEEEILNFFKAKNHVTVERVAVSFLSDSFDAAKKKDSYKEASVKHKKAGKTGIEAATIVFKESIREPKTVNTPKNKEG